MSETVSPTCCSATVEELRPPRRWYLIPTRTASCSTCKTPTQGHLRPDPQLRGSIRVLHADHGAGQSGLQLRSERKRRTGALVTANPGDLGQVPCEFECVQRAQGDGIFGRALVHPDRNNLAPRFGAAYRIGDHMVMKGGYAIFYQAIDRMGSSAALPLNPPQLIDFPGIRVAIQRGAEDAAAPAVPRGEQRVQSAEHRSSKP